MLKKRDIKFVKKKCLRDKMHHWYNSLVSISSPFSLNFIYIFFVHSFYFCSCAFYYFSSDNYYIQINICKWHSIQCSSYWNLMENKILPIKQILNTFSSELIQYVMFNYTCHPKMNDCIHVHTFKRLKVQVV